jgi:hypothetical protein
MLCQAPRGGFLIVGCLRHVNTRVRLPVMAKHSQGILELARRGAQHRYEELKAEMESLVSHFPGLTGIGRDLVRRGRRAAGAAAAELRPRKRRKMSAAARKRISEAQKARWAKQKKKSAQKTM